MEHEKRFIITESEKQQIWNWICERQAGLVNRFLDNLPEFDDEETKKELRLVYEFLRDYPEILQGIHKYLLLNDIEKEKKDVKMQGL